MTGNIWGKESAGEEAEFFWMYNMQPYILYLSVVYTMRVYWPHLTFEQVNLYIFCYLILR